MGNQKIINEGGKIGSGKGLINQNAQDFKILQEKIKKHAEELDKTELIQNRLLSLKFQMESYLEEEHPKEVISAGQFLEKLVKSLDIKKKTFAAYIDYEESNMSAIFKGRRKINTDLAIKFGEIFSLDPAIWLHIQSKNELLEIIDSEKEKYNKYSLEDLLKLVRSKAS